MFLRTLLARATVAAPLLHRAARPAAITAAPMTTKFRWPLQGFARPQPLALAGSQPAGVAGFATSTTVQSQFAVNRKRRTARLKAKLKAKQKRLRRDKTNGPWK
ncbi:hypothetical protein THASP1DRAFT_30877 [Thamnocephalis sphaerospora]|uniref:Uncharacterized protein n=1 Tax=Thamnocephalis sphaerospora TaxID=78915 RepID=A0A4P9XMZ7_9FUNG|nr:hypothetical protein THASP1DRAFT_30877 [Thamnocephalis sphaerospora]|eukprot:RKP07303.1 hypothetical protein THASP1DRAFT_30877 [Thamnocephalis sphaerospora]